MGMVAAGLFFVGQFSLFTYVRPFLEMVTGLGVPRLSLALLAMGLSGFVGTLLISGLIRRGLYTTLAVIPVLMAVLGVAPVVCGSLAPLVFGLLSLWGWWPPPRRQAGGPGSPAPCRRTPKPVAA